jgi:uncharacterized protein
MFGNENDRPYLTSAPIEGVAAMTAIVQALKPMIKLPFGVNYLWDPCASIAVAAATGAQFVREIFTGVFASDMGLWAPDCSKALRLRRNLGRPDLKLLFNINAEFAHSLDARPIELRAKSAIFSSLADAILVSGPITGQAVNQSDLRKVSEAIQGTPVFANTGVNIDNVDLVGRGRGHRRNPFQGRRQHLECGRRRAGEEIHGCRRQAAAIGGTPR